jgi:hypothetical protein
MRILSQIFILTILILSCNSIPTEKNSNALLFNNNLVSITREVTTDLNSYLNLTKQYLEKLLLENISSEEKKQYQIDFSNLKTSISTKIDKIKSYNEFDEEIKLKYAAIEYLNTCFLIVDEEFYNIATICKNEVNYDDLILLMEYTLSAWKKLILLEKKTKNVQIEFAKKYNINLPKEQQNWTWIEIEYLNAKVSLESLKSQNK